MLGASRGAYAEGEQALLDALGLPSAPSTPPSTSSTDGVADGQSGTVDPGQLAEELFGVADAVSGSGSLRRALTDASRDGHDRAGLVGRLLGGKVSPQAQRIVEVLVTQRWSDAHDLVTALEHLGVSAVIAGAERAGRADQVEDELFRFERTLDASGDLQNALAEQRASVADKEALLARLLEGRSAPETQRLVQQAVRSSHGRRLGRVLEDYLRLAQVRRDQLAAHVISATPLDPQHAERLQAVLERIYGRKVHLNLDVDPSVVGGLKVQVGDEVVDGTIARRLEQARRHLGA